MKYSLGPWEVNVSDQPVLVPEGVKEEVERWLNERWAPVEYSKQMEYYSRWEVEPFFRRRGCPSGLVRVDCTITEEGVRVFECEQAPAGLGIWGLACKEGGIEIPPEFREFMREVKGVVMMPSRKERWEETILIFQLMRIPTKLAFVGDSPDNWRQVEGVEQLPLQKLIELPGGPLWVRGSPGDAECPEIIVESRSIVPVIADGDKRALISLQEAARVHSPLNLPWEQPFVVKPLQGSGGHGVLAWHPSRKVRDELGGFATRKKFEEADFPRIMQPYYPPLKLEEGKLRVVSSEPVRGWRGILRVFAIFRGSRYEVVGGVLNVRENQVKIHGSSDAIFAPLLFE